MDKSEEGGAPGQYPEESAAREFAAPAPSPAQQLRFTLLIVEDNQIFKKYLTKALQARFPHITLATAAGARHALHQIHVLRPALIFTDMHLADGNGFELTRRIRETALDAKIVFFTSYDFHEYRDQALSCGADHFLAKGTATIDDIFSLVESIIASRVAR